MAIPVDHRVITRLSEVWSSIERVATARGALRVGASDLADAHSALFDQWLERGHDATMAYLRKNQSVRRNPAERFPWARSVVVITVPYAPTRCTSNDCISSHVARYAGGDDYHVVLDQILSAIEAELKRVAPDIQTRRYVDTGPLSDRSYAAQAGLGWIGKNGMLIDPEHGSYFFIGTLLTSLDSDVTAAEVSDRCGTCTRCVDACPTSAIQPDRTIDSHACISYATIEHRGAIPDPVKERLGTNLFGCDICNEVCPWNQAPAEAAAGLAPRDTYRATPVTDLLRFTQADFSRVFKKRAIKRAKRAGLIRNAILIAPEIPAKVLEALGAEIDEGIRDALKWRRRGTSS
jgi:epoxyqueuosine reductase